METPPQLLDGGSVIEAADVSAAIPGIRPITRLAIVRFIEKPGVFLYYCDENWNDITHVEHPSVAAAKARARFEYTGMTVRWEKVS
jgi:hypothetical protein